STTLYRASPLSLHDALPIFRRERGGLLWRDAGFLGLARDVDLDQHLLGRFDAGDVLGQAQRVHRLDELEAARGQSRLVRLEVAEIGRASCRERGEFTVGVGV